MKKKIWMMTLVSLLPGKGWAASKIESVVVFADRAKVTRVAGAQCEGGTASASFDRLPMQLDVRTLRGDARGGTAIGVSSSVITETEPADERAKDLERKQEEVQTQIAAVNDDLASLKTEMDRITQYGGVFSQILNEAIRDPRPSVASWNATLDRLRAEQLGLAKKKVEQQARLRELTRKSRRLAKQLARLGAGTARQHRRAEVAVSCKGRSVKVELTYVVPGAQWRPEYDLDFVPRRGRVGPGRAKLTVAAVIRQSTGEDWSNVKLALSTAKPRLGTEAPKPAPIWVSARKNEEGKVLVQGHERREVLAGGGGQEADGAAGAELEDGGQAVVLRMPHRVSVVADGRPYWAPVDVISTRATAKLVTIPKLSPYVYRAVSFTNPAAYPLLEGSIHSFRSGSYVGDTRLSFKGTGEPIEVSLGIDEELSVERKTRTHKDEGAGFLSSTKHMARAYRISVKNRSSGRQRIEVRENIPVPKIEDVEVELIPKGTTRGYERDEERGFMTWTLNLARGQSGQVDLAYEIHLPDDWKVR